MSSGRAGTLWSKARRVSSVLVVLVMAFGALATVVDSPVAADAPGFSDSIMFTGLESPSSIQFASDGRVFVAEKTGQVKVFDSLSDSSPDVFVDLRTQVHNFWDRGMLGMALAPGFPADPHVYLLYAHDAAIGGTAPRWGNPGESSDECPDPPGANDDGCVISGRLSRFVASGNSAGPEQVIIEDWCAQFPSHTVGNIRFGADGALYVSGGDGASFNYVDYGQTGGNVCNDHPGGPNLSPPLSRGGALRSQKVITDGVPVSLDGTLLRIDPATGEGLPSNPFASSADPNARRIIATGLRNPFRFAIRPGTSEIYVGDVGWNTWEEINIVNAADGVAENFGWPCYEGYGVQPGYAALGTDLCEDLYASGNATSPLFVYPHGAPTVPGDGCATAGGSSITGVTFNDDSNNYPDQFDGALFFGDYSRRCIWVMYAGADGRPDPNTAAHFMDVENPAFLTTGPDGNIWYADIIGGDIHRITYGTATSVTCPDTQFAAEYFNNPVLAGAPVVARCETAIDHDWAAGSPDPTVNVDGFSARWTSTRTFAAGTYVFTARVDDGMRVYVDDQLVIDAWVNQPVTTYTGTRALDAGEHDIRVEYYDNGLSAVAQLSWALVGGGGPNGAPTPTISTPTAATTWKVGDTITFSGSATDAEDGALPPSALSWRVALLHCPDACHEHLIQTFAGVASGSIIAPDHDYPSRVQFQLTATDSAGRTTTTTRVLEPQTATLRFESVPSGLLIAVGSSQSVTPFERTVIVGSANSVTAVSPQTAGASTYTWASWSDGSPRSHNIVAAAGTTTHTATYTSSGGGDPGSCPVGQFTAEYFANVSLSGVPVLTRCEATVNQAWGAGSPGPGLPVDGFSVRWTGSPTFAAGSHVFSATSDDGVRVFVDGTSVIDAWNDHGPTTFTGSRTLTAGVHQVRVEFYENGGGAMASLSWENFGSPGGGGDPLVCPAGQFAAEYFNNLVLSGSPVLSRCEASINHEWGAGSPGPGVGVDGFSVRWTGSPTFAAGVTTFSATADDGVRVFVDDAVVLDEWRDQGPTTFTASRTLTAGVHPVRVEYFERGGGAVARVSWTTAGGPVGNAAPVAVISAPLASGTWSPGQTISFAGSATDAEDGAVPASSLSWRVVVEHCEAAVCHEHPVGVFSGASGSFVAPDHPYPSTLKVTLTAADSLGEVGTATVQQAQTAPGGGGDPGSCPVGQFTAEYFANVSLSGVPVLTRCEATVNQAWGAGSPGPGLPVDGFSVRWTGSPTFAAGSHVFSATSDDGVRVFVDGTSVIDAWNDHGPTTFTGSRTLTAGVHQVRVEFYENGGGAMASLSWENFGSPGGGGDPLVCPAGQFAAEYFNNLVLSGSPVLSRCEASINHEWGAGSPGPGVGVDGFSVRWTGSPTFAAGVTTFSATADDGVRVFVDDAVVLDEWRDQGPTTFTASRTLTAGVHPVRVEYFERGGGAVARVSWTTAGGPVGNAAPVAVISAPLASGTWSPGQTISFAGSATDAEDGAVPASSLSWRVVVEHCEAAVCHEHPVGVFSGASGSFVAPDHPYPSTLKVTLTAADLLGEVGTATVQQAQTAPGGGGDPGSCPVGQFTAEYFANVSLSGVPVLTRCEATVNNDVGIDSPGPGVPADGYSVRWTGTQTFTAGSWVFTAVADDGVRVFVDGVVRIDRWQDQGPTTFTATVPLTAGSHVIRVEFYENAGGAMTKLSWATAGGPAALVAEPPIASALAAPTTAPVGGTPATPGGGTTWWAPESAIRRLLTRLRGESRGVVAAERPPQSLDVITVSSDHFLTFTCLIPNVINSPSLSIYSN